jgi:hypothetical protein
MPSNFEQFEKELRIFSEISVPKDFQKLVQKLAFEVLRRVIIKTPVDTGRARGNWMVAINNIPEGFIEIGSLSSEQATSFALSKGIPVIEAAKPFTTISIANNVPYIGVLEFGGSKQAPGGMARVTIAEIQAQFK